MKAPRMPHKFHFQPGYLNWLLLLTFCLAAWFFPGLPAQAQLAPSTLSLYLPIVYKDYEASCPSPGIFLDVVPPIGSYENLRGHVACVKPADYRVAVYIKVSGWWTKPYFDSPLTPIQSDGAWVTDITTGGSDQLATDIAAFLVPKGYSPPQMSGGAVLPDELYANAHAYTSAARGAQRIGFQIINGARARLPTGPVLWRVSRIQLIQHAGIGIDQ